MDFLSAAERTFLSAVSQLAYCNPFLPESADFERTALGNDYVAGEPVWSQPVKDPERPRANVWRIAERLGNLAEQLNARLLSSRAANEQDLLLYEDGVIQLLYNRYYPQFLKTSFCQQSTKERVTRWSFYRDFLADWRHFLPENVSLPTRHDAGHTFACFR